MNIWKRFFGQKDSQARIALSLRMTGNPVPSPRNYEGFSREGYMKNVVVYRCVQIIAKACAGIEWEAYKKRKGGKPIELEDHPVLDLLTRPNPLQGRAAFIEAFVAYYTLTGNSFMEAVRPTEKAPPMELWPVRPDRMQIVPGVRGYPAKYLFKTGDSTKEWIVNPVTLQADIFHMKSFNPVNDWWGMSPLEAAMYAVDQSNAGNKWNLSLLQNSATPSGIMQVKATDANPNGMLNEKQFSQLKSELENEYQGSRNAGRPMLLEGGLEWKQISLSPKDMEFLKSHEVSAIDICEAFGVPPEMLGLGQKTYSNYSEARMSFYEDTVLPIMDLLETDLNMWLCPMFGEDVKVCYDKDDIEALAPKREKKFTSVATANFLTQNEKREAVNYEPIEGWDVFVIGSQIVSHPDDFAGEEETQEGEEGDGQSGDPQAGEGNGADEAVQNGKKPPKKDPKPEDDEENEEEGKAWKSFNLLNSNEKRSSWKKQNWRRKRLEAAMTRDLTSDFKEMYKDMRDAMRGETDHRVIEYALLKQVNDHMPVIRKTIQRHIKYTVEDFGQATFTNAKSFFKVETKATKTWDDWAKRYVDTRTAKAIGSIEDTTRKQVTRVVKRLVERAVIDGESTSDIADELVEKLPSVGKSRANLISRTEVASASNNASIEAVRSMEIPNMVKEWVSSNDDRVRDGGPDGDGPDHESMNGVQVNLEEDFEVPPGDEMDGPGDEKGGAGQVCNCRCVLVFKSKN